MNKKPKNEPDNQEAKVLKDKELEGVNGGNRFITLHIEESGVEIPKIEI